ncbi:hypothetical protein ACSBR2_011465 [Camellia fascicularis]
MVVLSCAYSAYPTHAVSLRAHRGFSPERSTSPVSVSLTHHHRHHHHDHLFVPEHFGGSTGYGHEDAGGREALDQAFAEIVGAESAIVRSQFFSGTHDITCALFAYLDKPSHRKAIEPVIESNQRQGFSFSLSRSSEDLLKLLKIIHMLRGSRSSTCVKLRGLQSTCGD